MRLSGIFSGKVFSLKFADGKLPIRNFGIAARSGHSVIVHFSAFQPFYRPSAMEPISARIRPGRTQEGLVAVDRTWHRFVPTVAIQRRFQDASLNYLFIDDEREGKIFAIFVGIAIFTACHDLFGLASFTAEPRMKEIGITKIPGAHA